MAKKDKDKKTVRVAAERAARWTVRGVPARMQKAAGNAARARGQTLGQWLCEAVEAALTQVPDGPGAAAAGWRETVEARLAKLESALIGVADGQSATPGEIPRPPDGGKRPVRDRIFA
jgi:hypothetical protein